MTSSSASVTVTKSPSVLMEESAILTWQSQQKPLRPTTKVWKQIIHNASGVYSTMIIPDLIINITAAEKERVYGAWSNERLSAFEFTGMN